MEKMVKMTQILKESRDEDNPEYAFQVLSPKVLSMIVTGKVDAVKVAKETLANMGLDAKGKWVGHAKAREIFGLKSKK
jgi:hypothetical protein